MSKKHTLIIIQDFELQNIKFKMRMMRRGTFNWWLALHVYIHFIISKIWTTSKVAIVYQYMNYLVIPRSLFRRSNVLAFSFKVEGDPKVDGSMKLIQPVGKFYWSAAWFSFLPESLARPHLFFLPIIGQVSDMLEKHP